MKNQTVYLPSTLHYLMTASQCFFLIQNYQESQSKTQKLKTELHRLGFQLQKLPTVSLSQAANPFFKQSPWIPITNANFIAYATQKPTGSVFSQIQKLLTEYNGLPLFCKQENTVLDLQRLSLVEFLPASSFSLQPYVKKNASIPFFPTLIQSFFFLLKRGKKQLNKYHTCYDAPK